MIDSLRRAAPALPSTDASTEATATPTAPATPAAPVFAADTVEAARTRAVSLDLSGAPPVVDAAKSFFDSGLFGLFKKDKEGPQLLHLQGGWTPQGQGYDAGRGEVLTSYYNEDHQVLVSIQDKKTGEEKHNVILGGTDGVKPPSHGGGISTDGDNVYVADTDHIYVYSREELEKAESECRPAVPSQVMEVPPDVKDPATGIALVSNGSFMTVKDGYAYVGAYSKDGDGKVGAVWRYEIDEQTGAIIEGSRQGPIRAPDRAQGMAVVDGALLFTTGDKKLMYQPFDEESFTADIDDRVNIANGRIDSWAQGFNIIDGELWVTYESGSQKYDGEDGRQHIQRIPLDELDLEDAGLEPEDLEG